MSYVYNEVNTSFVIFLKHCLRGLGAGCSKVGCSESNKEHSLYWESHSVVNSLHERVGHSVMSTCSPPGSSLHEILQARILEWIAIPFSRGSSQLRD